MLNKSYLISFIFALLLVSVLEVSAQASVLNDQKYIGDDGVFHIVGEIQNDLGVPLNQVVVIATLYSEENQILGTAKTTSVLETIMPDNRGPFDLLFVNQNAQLIERYTIELEYELTDFKAQVLEVTSLDSRQDALDNFIISGTVTNHGDITSNIVVVIATLYDKEGNVATVGKAYPEPGYLGSGEKTPFVISFADKAQANKAVNYNLSVESEEHTTVPEFPLGSGILLVVSVSAYVLITRMPDTLAPGLARVMNPRLALHTQE